MEHQIKEGTEERLVIVLKSILETLQEEDFTPRDIFNIAQSLFVTVAHNALRPEAYDLIFANMREKLDAETSRKAQEANND